MSSLNRHFNTKRYFYVTLLSLIAIASLLGYVSYGYKFFGQEYEWNTFYIHYGILLAVISVLLNIQILTRVNEKSTTSNSLSLELLENLIINSNGKITIISPTFLLGDTFSNKIEFNLYTKALKKISNAGRQIKIICLNIDVNKINSLSKLNYEDLLQNSDFKDSQLMQYHYKLSKEFYYENPTKQRDYLRTILKNLEYLTNSSTAKNVSLSFKSLNDFGDDKILLVLSDNVAAMGGWADDGVVSLNLIENKGAIQVLNNLKTQYE